MCGSPPDSVPVHVCPGLRSSPGSGFGAVLGVTGSLVVTTRVQLKVGQGLAKELSGSPSRFRAQRRPCKVSDEAGHSLRTKGLRTVQRMGSWVQAQPRGAGERQQGLAHWKVWSQPVAKSSMHPSPTIRQLLGAYSAPAQAVDTRSLA